MSREGFLSRIDKPNSFLSESKILSQLGNLEKAVAIVMNDLKHFEKYYYLIENKIQELARKDFHLIEIKEDGTLCCAILGSRTVSSSEMINIIEENFKEYDGYCFVVNSGVEFLYEKGKINNEVEACLEKTKTMQEKLGVLQPVSALGKVFNQFLCECEYESSRYYDTCFDPKTNKVLAKIKEQELRNILFEYLKTRMKGDISTEYCTDLVNDEESVDIYINDGIERAIIEVKFSLPQSFYHGSTYYSFSTRIEDGIKQLDKYAVHLAKDSRWVDYAYLYMFYINRKEFEEMEKEANKKYELLKVTISSELKSVFSGFSLNDMRKWIPTG